MGPRSLLPASGLLSHKLKMMLRYLLAVFGDSGDHLTVQVQGALMYMYKDRIRLIWHGGMFSFIGPSLFQGRTGVQVDINLQQGMSASKANKSKMRGIILTDEIAG